jgi:uncharacterized membrane protein YfcA
MPTFLLAIDPLLVLSGFIVGGIVGLTGVGGGSLMTPVLVLLFGFHPVAAVGTDLLYAAATKSAGTLVNGFNKSVEWPIVFRLAAGSVPAAAATILWLSVSGAHGGGGPNPVITIVLGSMLVVTALTLFFRVQLQRFAIRHRELPPRQQAILTVLTGAILGVLVSISSVGAGAVGVTALLLLYPRLPVLRIVGSDIAHAVPLTLVAGLGHWAIGNVDWHTLISLLIGSIPGILIASHYVPRIREDVLRYILGAILAIVGIRLMFS